MVSEKLEISEDKTNRKHSKIPITLEIRKQFQKFFQYNNNNSCSLCTNRGHFRYSLQAQSALQNYYH